MSFSVPLVSLVSGSHLSFPNCQPHPCNLHPIPFLHVFLSCSSCIPQQNYSLPHSDQDMTLLSISLAMAIYNSEPAQLLVILLMPLVCLLLVEKTTEPCRCSSPSAYISNLTVSSTLPRKSLTNL